MPIFLKIAERFNERFRSDNIGAVRVDALAPGSTLSQFASNLGIAMTADERAFLERWPAGLQEALRAVLESAAKRRQPVSLTWAPGYDYEVRLWEARSTAKTQGHITIHLRGRYPDE